ncbi:hypothetical protein [Mongoliitalea lutea]|uniref:MetA-pathway of phenol degradation n=1 Tax=Mongoliitalea lutea TaxID=849756 RepID=A0A8J3G3Y5_9BACT|nr:hypothetical protein [Mongoliitalea lutea]GHB24476.1 hypothetical protein GCM10008106_01510 [Mongoliitalea lutea]
MKKIFIISILIFLFSDHLLAQDSTFIKINKWLTDKNFAIRQTFDGSKNENKPASISFQENHKTTNDFFNADIAIKLSQLELLKNKGSILLFYPKVEWHKSNDSTDLKNKLDGGLNFEFIPFGLKAPNIANGLPNGKFVIAPYFIGNSSFKRNFINNVYETKLSLQVSLSSNYRFLPGSSIRDKNENFRARYYPYFGIEYNYLPDLVTKGQTEDFSTFFIRFFTEIWVIPQTLQVNIDGTYREIINNSTSLRTSLPILASSVYLYPGKQESLGIGYEYKHGYDNTGTFQLMQISSLKLSWKI